MISATASLLLFASLAFNSLAQENETSTERFPASSAIAEGLSPDALAKLDKLVQSFVDDDDIVGAELLVIKNGKSILHESYGWRDIKAEVKMENDSVFCVRSMTKPLIGASILMLLDDNLLELDDLVSKYLPSFDVEGSRKITIEHLLTHTSGLPMSLIANSNLEDLEGIQAVAKLGAGYELGFEPGSAINYSDQGTDMLTAVLEVASGMTAAEFVRTRLLDPLGMQSSACLMEEENPLRARGCSKYIGSGGTWTEFWNTEKPPLFPFFLGSQGLYSTLEDYARFMEFWLRKGRVGKDRLLGSRYVRKALTPSAYPLGGSTGFPGLTTNYGFLMELWSQEDADGEKEVVVYGHTGSDGTHAWAFPEQKAMVLYFTQTRGTITGLQVEEALGELLLGVPFDANQAAPPFEEYLGYYWEGEGDMYRVIVRDGDDMSLEIMGKAIVPLIYIGEDRWKLQPQPTSVIEFDRSEDGVVTGYHIGDHEEFRFQPSTDLPSTDELAARVAEVHRIDLIESLGPLNIKGQMSFPNMKLEGLTEVRLDWPNRFRSDFVTGEMFERSAFDGENAWYADVNQAPAILEGPRAEQVRLGSLFSLFGDWHTWYPELEVIQKLNFNGSEVILVRAGGLSAPASTLAVEVESGRLLVHASVSDTPMGRLGSRTRFSDFREVSGMLLPFRTEIEFGNNMLGTAANTVTEVLFDVPLEEGLFELTK